MNKDVTLELRKKEAVSTLATVKKHEISSNEIIPVKNFSDVDRLLRVTAYVLRYKHNTLSRIRVNEKIINELTVVEIENAEKFLIKHDQLFIIKSEKFKLQKKSLNIFVDEDGLLRVKGRLENSDVGYASKFPLLFRDDRLAYLYIMKSHVEVKHLMLESTLNHLRNRFWIIRGRQVVKRVLYRCVTCRFHQGKTLTPPTSPPLPSYRVTSDFCFQSTGMDYAGPLLVKPIYTESRKL